LEGRQPLPSHLLDCLLDVFVELVGLVGKHVHEGVGVVQLLVDLADLFCLVAVQWHVVVVVVVVVVIRFFIVALALVLLLRAQHRRIHPGQLELLQKVLGLPFQLTVLVLQGRIQGKECVRVVLQRDTDEKLPRWIHACITHLLFLCHRCLGDLLN